MDQNVLNKIIAWAKKEEPIRVLLLTGSLASKGSKDELSDYDIALFTTDIDNYLRDDA
ncbi:aminoglycoside 6-adenylyltransferase, partial [Candidatus Dependentiae bacterium]